MFKKIISILVTLSICFSLLVVYADVNVDGGGGGMGDATTGCGWTPGDDGVRVTIVREKDRCVMRPSVDFSNRPHNDVDAYGGYTNKIQYKRKSLSLQNGITYVSRRPGTPMPTIINASGGSNIAAIKSYFGTENNIQNIASIMAFDYDELINGDYVLMIEPIAYFRFFGKTMALTATEAALYDMKVDGNLRKLMGNLTHQNMPLAMFLERADIGFSAWGGAATGYMAGNISKEKRASHITVFIFFLILIILSLVKLELYSFSLSNLVIFIILIS